MVECDTPRCHRSAVVTVIHGSGVYIFEPDSTEADVCVPCAVAYREGHNRPRNEFTYEIRDDVAPEDIDVIREQLVGP